MNNLHLKTTILLLLVTLACQCGFTQNSYFDCSGDSIKQIMRNARTLMDSLDQLISVYDAVQKDLAKEKNVQDLQNQNNLQRNYFALLGVMLILIVIAFYSRLQFMRKTKKQLEEKNIEIQIEKLRAEQSERFKQQFLANMSHEIRTPMNAVMGMTNLLIDKNPRDDQRNYLDGIKKSSETLLHIINDILDLSKIEAGKIEVEQIDFSLHEVVVQVEEMLLHKADEKGIKLLVDFDPGIPVLIGDPVRIYQILMNLVGNAIKFTDEGYVKISVKNQAAVDSNNIPILFSIIDTGIGIPEDKLETVFEKFNQAHVSDNRKYGGTGLGLSISKQLVELLGGNISVESEEGTGTIFSFVLILEKGSAEGIQRRIMQDESIDGQLLNGLKILIVDDNDYNLIVASDTLTLIADVDITTCTNGRDAIEKIRTEDFDIILMDVQMPEMNGLEVTRYIRSNFDAPKKDIPIIALTASVLRTDLEKCKAAGMNDYIPKPFKASQLIKGIANLLGLEIRTVTGVMTKSVYGFHSKEMTSQVIDLNYLRNFCAGDMKRMKKYIHIFLESTPAFIDKINAAIKDENFSEIADQLHANKTKWMMMGMNETKMLAGNIEQNCRNDAIDSSVMEDIQKLMVLIQKATIELARF